MGTTRRPPALPVQPHSATLPAANRAADANADFRPAISNLNFAIRESLATTDHGCLGVENVRFTHPNSISAPLPQSPPTIEFTAP